MAKIISFEGPMGSGKTTLVNYFSEQLSVEKQLEHSQDNPFIDKFYAQEDVKLETELTFLLLHFSLLKRLISKPGVILTDFSIEKDMVFARMNLEKKELEIFKHCYDYVIETVSKPDIVIYLDLPFDILWQRILKRGRRYEIKANPVYFQNYAEQLKSYFEKETKSKTIFINRIFELSNCASDEGEIQQIMKIIREVF